MKKTVFHLPNMDCMSEERLVRMALQDSPAAHLDFDLAERRVTVLHDDDPHRLLVLLAPLGFQASIVETVHVSEGQLNRQRSAPAREQATLKLLLAINAAMFFVELAVGWLAQSAGLIADSLDMFADAAVYGVSLYAVGKVASAQVRAARLSGYLQLMLALGALLEVARRFFAGSQPEAPAMMAIAFLALAANIACMALISKHREGGVHMRASWIFSTNDVIANLGVILAGALVAWTGSAAPDLVVGTIIALVVLLGALRILRLSRTSESE
jgi:Co/Zn/Cd efflux system component